MKASNYKQRHASPEVSVHERLFARAMEKDTKAKMQTDQLKPTKPISYVNKVSKELLKVRCNKPGIGVSIIYIFRCYIKIQLKERREQNSLR